MSYILLRKIGPSGVSVITNQIEYLLFVMSRLTSDYLFIQLSLTGESSACFACVRVGIVPTVLTHPFTSPGVTLRA